MGNERHYEELEEDGARAWYEGELHCSVVSISRFRAVTGTKRIARFVKTGILSQAVIDNLEKAGFEFATVDDAARAVMKQCSDPSINGEHHHLWLFFPCSRLSGRAFAITPRSVSESGYVDLDADEYEKDPLKGFQEGALGAKHRQVWPAPL